MHPLSHSDPFDDHRLPNLDKKHPGTFAGFGAARGVWTYLELSIARIGATVYDIAIEMNGQRYAYTHDWAVDDASDKYGVMLCLPVTNRVQLLWALENWGV